VQKDVVERLGRVATLWMLAWLSNGVRGVRFAALFAAMHAKGFFLEAFFILFFLLVKS